MIKDIMEIPTDVFIKALENGYIEYKKSVENNAD